MAKKSLFGKLLTAVAKEVFSKPKPIKKATTKVLKPKLTTLDLPKVKQSPSTTAQKKVSANKYNISARTSEHKRWGKLDFVVGYEIKPSNNPCQNEICRHLSGKYPKWFKWSGWADNCRCYQVAVMLTAEEQEKMTQFIISGRSTKNFVSKNRVNDVPPNFKAWINNNRDYIKSLKTKPRFVKDNFINGDIDKGLKY